MPHYLPAQATGDLMYAEGQRDLKDLANEVVEDMGGGYSDDAYRAAIRKSMEAYGATEEEILESIIAAGYKSGGRVALRGGGVMNAKRGLVDGPGGYAGESQQNRFNFDDTFSLSERLNPRDPENELIAEHMQIGKLPFNITARILELNRGGKSYEDIAEITGVDIEDITSMLEVANNPDSIDPVDKQGKVDYNLFEEIVKERDQIRERPEHLSYNAKGGRVGLAFGGIPDAVEAVDVKEKETITESLGGSGGESDMSQWKIGDHRPLKYTGAIDDLWKMNLDEGSPLEYIFKIGMTVRAPLIDVIRNVAKTGAEAAKLIAAAGELGWDLTKGARDIIGDVGAAGLEGTKWALGHSDKFRFAQKPYLALRMRGMSDDEARLSLQDSHIGDFRKDKDLMNKLENRLMDKKVGESPDQISMEEVELYPGRGEKTSRMSLRADGGRINKARWSTQRFT